MEKKILEPVYSGYKSFYNSAHVIDRGNVKELKSYKTIVCKIGKNGNFIRIWDGWSQTTLRHVNEFRQQNGLTKITKKEWLAMPIAETKRKNREIDEELPFG